ncbi:MAG: hypothetical protein CL570_01170 [Alphaproteobacteria bacterium]|nr:hypothetical protein [Alphaproteobacteria bacterium]HCQ71539.1 hypothetical protein [Rhodospirillaceae bacterium]|tara:strand:+ start:52215 stop:52733 length:519 start_codon:yes stop_codon:yes gene_type:complete
MEDNKGVFNKLAKVTRAGALVAAMATVSPPAEASATDVVVENGKFGVVIKRPSGDRDPNGPEFVITYSKMYKGDYTYDKDGVQGRAIDVDDLVVSKDDPTKWILTARFLARAADIADGSSFDGAFKQTGRAVTSKDFLQKYAMHINSAHHKWAEVQAVLQYAQTHYPPTPSQ